LIPKKIKKITTTNTVVVTFDPEKDIRWAKDVNKKMTKNDFELIEFSPGVVVYQQEFEEVYK